MAAALALDADADAGIAAAPQRMLHFFVAAVVTFNARTRLGQHGERDN